MAVHADSLLALKVHQEHTSQLHEVCKDHALAMALAADQDARLLPADVCSPKQADSLEPHSAGIRLICCACNGHTQFTLGYLAALCLPKGTIICKLCPFCQVDVIRYW